MNTKRSIRCLQLFLLRRPSKVDQVSILNSCISIWLWPAQWFQVIQRFFKFCLHLLFLHFKITLRSHCRVSRSYWLPALNPIIFLKESRPVVLALQLSLTEVVWTKKTKGEWILFGKDHFLVISLKYQAKSFLHVKKDQPSGVFPGFVPPRGSQNNTWSLHPTGLWGGWGEEQRQR